MAAVGFLLKATEGEDSVNRASAWAEAKLKGGDGWLELSAKAVVQDVGVDLSSYGEEGDASVAGTIGGGALAFVDGSDVGLVPRFRKRNRVPAC
jgi:hypothetical protein